MQEIKIVTKARVPYYTVFIGTQCMAHIQALLAPFTDARCVIITDARVGALYAKTLVSLLTQAGFCVHLLEIPEGEAGKSAQVLLDIYSRLYQLNIERQDTILALGGGAVGDLAGYAAATYMRGVRLVQVPTTLLAQVDSSIGGKTGINLSEGKNLAGAFYQPYAVLIDTACLATLPARERQAGMGEVIKYGVIADAALFMALEVQTLTDLELVQRCCSIKAGYVTKDPYEREGHRIALNFGHTFGHALEKTLGYGRLLHGEAVALGMVAAARWAQQRFVAAEEVAPRIEALLEAYALPTCIAFDRVALLEAMLGDKKMQSGSVQLVLPVSIGEVRICAFTKRELLELLEALPWP